MATYQTRISGYSGTERLAGDAALDAYGGLYGRLERKLFADVAAGRSPVSLKSLYLRRHGIPARMFNAIRISLDGKVASVKEQQRLRVDSLVRRIARAVREIEKAGKRGRLDQVHHKTRRPGNLRSRLSRQEADIAAGTVRLCFGSKRLWQRQHELQANGYDTHEEWTRAGGRPAAMSSLCWEAGTRRLAASSAWPVLRITAP